MLLPKQLLLPAFLIISVSCSTIAKQEEQVASTNLSNDIITLKPKILEKATDNSVGIKTPFLSKKSTIIPKAKSLKTDPQTSTSLSEDFKIFDQDFQNFTINPDFDTAIICKEGTKIKIAHSSFLIESTQAEVMDNITLHVKEFYKTSDILLAGLSTHSDSSILETGGMLFIQAISNGKLCKLKDSVAIEIAFPFAVRKDSMLLFTGIWKDKVIDWKQVLHQKVNSLNTVYEDAVFPGGNLALRNFIQKNIYYPELGPLGTIVGGRVEIDFIVDEAGAAKVVTLRDSSYERFRSVILNAFAKMPKWKFAKQNGVPVKSKHSQTVTFVGEEYLPDTAYKSKFEAKIDTSNLHKKKTAEISQYIFSASALGWINCDRFYRSKKAKINFYVDCRDFTELDIKLVFHNFKSVLDGPGVNKICEFKSVPIDEPVTVVVVKKINNKTFVSLTESNTTLGRVNNLRFEEVTIDKLKQKIETLNNLR